jgi:hypothetical protein
VEIEAGRSRADGDKLVALRPNHDDFPMGGEMIDAQTRAGFLTLTEPAKSKTHKLVCAYASNLIHTAVDIKDKVKGDNVSAANVEEASFTLSQHEKRGLAKVAGVLGGILLGTGLSTLASMIQSSVFTRGGTILAVLTVAIGGFAIALDLSEGLLDALRKRKPP